MDLVAGLVNQSVTFAAWTTATGVPVTVTSVTAGLSLWYRRGVAGAKVPISPSNLATLETAHAEGGILVIQGAEHRLDLPDAATLVGPLTISWGGTATGITIDGGTANLIGQANTATDATHVNGSSTAANALKVLFKTVMSSVVNDLAATTTSFVVNALSDPDCVNSVLMFHPVASSLPDELGVILSYDPVTYRITLAWELSSEPTNGDAFYIANPAMLRSIVGADSDTLKTLSDALDALAASVALEATAQSVKTVTDKLDTMIEAIP